MSKSQTNNNAAEEQSELRNIVEAAIFTSSEPIGVRKLQALFPDEAQPTADEIKAVISELEEQYAHKGVELVKIGKGWRFRSKLKYATWLRKLIINNPPRFSRALLETLSIIAYRQPVTRGDIEDIRGVAVSTDIIRALEERGWVAEIGHRDVPGRPALFGTTNEFLEYFTLSSLRDLPELMQPRELSVVAREMNLVLPEDQEEGESDSDDVLADDPIAEVANEDSNEESAEQNKESAPAQVIQLRRTAETSHSSDDADD